MINNDFGKNFLKNFQNRGNRAESPADAVGRLKSRAHREQSADAPAPADDAAATQDTFEPKTAQDILNTYTRSKGRRQNADNANANANASKKNENMSAEEKRQAELAEIMKKIEAEEQQKHGNKYKDKNDNRPDHANASSDNNRYKDKDKGKNGVDGSSSSSSSSASSSVSSVVENPGDVEGFLNDMPLFNEFKTSLMDAFKSMDSGTSGAIRAQYEFNYSSMQAIANAAGGFEYEETSVNVKFDLSYVKAANGGTSGKEIAEALEGATDFASLMDALEKVSSDPAFQGQLSAGNGAGATVGNADTAAATDGDAAATAKDEFIKQLKEASKPDFSSLIPGLGKGNLQQSLQDYFSPEATAGRILDFATAFFPMSDAYKKGGDTEEARQEFADMMGKAVQKGFDQALGSLGNIPDATREGIDKTHELVFKGFEDFVKNGMKKEKQNTYDALQGLEFTYEANITKRRVSMNYVPDDVTPAPALDAQA